MQIAVVGTGFVGVVTAAVLAKLGHQVAGLDIDQSKVDKLNAGVVPFYEPGLEDLLKVGEASGKLTFTTSYSDAVANAQICIIAVGTPSSPEGKADTSFVLSAIDSLAPELQDDAIVVVKSTVPPGILPSLRERIAQKTTVQFHLASMPEFLREGTAVADTLKPDRVVIGAEAEWSAGVLSELHKPLGAPIIITSPESAQLGKYAANSYLALRIGFINQIADLCEKTGADVQEVISIIGADARIGPHYWYPGLGYGGSCFPKDVRELAYASKQLGLGETLFVKLNELNVERPQEIFAHWTTDVDGWAGKAVAVLGLSFKPNTNDLREAPSLWLIPQLLAAGATVKAYDPQAIPEVKQILGTPDGVEYEGDLGQAVAGADIVIALVEWKEIITFNFGDTAVAEKKQRHFLDARNQFVPEQVVGWGFSYHGIGR